MNLQGSVVTGSLTARVAYAADAKLLGFDLHYLVDSLGSGDEFIK